MDSPRFATLTAPSVAAPLREQLAAIREALKHLRRSTLWKEHVDGGCYTVQVTRSAKTGQWHPHLHLLLDGKYVHQAKLREAWRHALNATRTLWNLAPDDPLIVDIRAIHSRSAIATYVARYIASPNALAGWPPDAIREYAAATHGVRMLTCFGNLHGTPLDVRDPNHDDSGSTYMLNVAELHHCALGGDADAIDAVYLLAELHPRTAAWFPGIPIQRDPPDKMPEHMLHRALIMAIEAASRRLRHELHKQKQRMTPTSCIRLG